MDREKLLTALDTEIARLQEARAAIAGISIPKRVSRPSATTAKATRSAPKKRTLSAAARKRIADAQKKRWAAQKKAATKAATKQITAKKQKKAAGKKVAKKVLKKTTKEVTVTRIPPKKQREREPRGPKKAPAGNALSGKSGVVAVPANPASNS
jgi:hypothetical protein